MKFFNAAQAAKRIGISDKTIRRWLADGKISAVRTPSNQLAIPESEVEKFRRQRAQFIQEEEVTTSHDQIDTLAAKLAELEQEVAELKKGQGLAHEHTTSPSIQTQPIDVMPKTEVPQNRIVEPKRAYTKQKNSGLPEGYILATDFANRHGVNRRTFQDHIKVGLGKGGLIHGPGVPEDGSVLVKDYVRAKERTKRTWINKKTGEEVSEKEYYLTPEQQSAALDFWRKWKVSFIPCDQADCSCHTSK